MDPALSQALSTLIGAMATAVLMFASYYWGPNGKSRKNRDDEDESDEPTPKRKKKKKVVVEDDEEDYESAEEGA